MPSVSKGFTLDLALAGSKVGIVETRFGGGVGALHGDYHNSLTSSRAPHSGSLLCNYKKYQHAGVLDPSVLIRESKLGGYLHSTTTTTATPQDALTAADLPRLRCQTKGDGFGTASSNGSGSVVGVGGSLGPEEVRYTNRQRILLEQDSNCRTRKLSNTNDLGPAGIADDINQALAFADKLSPTQQRLTQLSGVVPDEGLHVGPHATYKLKNRPFSSQVSHCTAGRPSGSAGSVTVGHRHSSGHLLNTTDQQEGLPGSQLAQRNQTHQNHHDTAEHSATHPSLSTGKPGRETLNWMLSPPGSHHTISQDLPARPPSPFPTESNCSGSPRPDDLSRIYIDAVAQENLVIKQEVQKSLKRLLQRAGWSGGAVSRAEVNALKVRLHRAKGHDGGCMVGRTGSIHSQDSGISSESITRDQQIVLTPRQSENQNLTLGTKATTMDPTHMIKLRRKKNLPNKKLKKHKSLGSGKKSRLKPRSDSLRRGNVDGTAAAPREQNLLNLAAYCRTMHVLPGEQKPKVDKRQISAPEPLPTRSTITAIYRERLPRVPQPTLTCDGNGIKDKNNNGAILTELALTCPATRKSFNLNATKVLPYAASVALASPRKSLQEGGRVYGAGPEEPQRLTKVYLSERQSGMLSELGIGLPCAPPATPMPDATKRIEYIPSMYDIRSQRAFRSKLEVLDRQDKKRKEKQQEQQAKKDKVAEKEHVKETKRHQRQQIYALNKVMTALENRNFIQFCSANGIQLDL